MSEDSEQKPIQPDEPKIEKKNILFFLPISETGKKLKADLEKNPEFEVLEATSGPEAIQVLKMVGPLVMIMTPKDQTDYQKQQAFLKVSVELIKRGMIHPALIYHRVPDQVLKVYQKMGVRELIQEPISTKGFLMKLNRMHTAIERLKKGNTQSESGQLQKMKLDSKGQQVEEVRKGQATFKMGPPVDFPSDCWLLETRKPVFAMGKWVIKLRGPSSIVGKWVEYTSEKIEKKPGEDLWKWEPLNKTADHFIKDKGAWIVRGKRPEYQDELWTFVAKNMEMFFVDEQGEPEHLKIAIMKDKDIQVAADSKAGLAMLELIHESVKQVLKDSGKKHLLEDEDVKVENLERDKRLDELRKNRPSLFRAEREALISFGFILAELMCLSHLSKNQIKDRILSFIDTEMQGKRMEIWVKGGEQSWKPIGSSDRKECEAGMLLNQIHKEVQIIDGHTLIAKLSADKNTEGALVIRGTQMEDLPEDFVKDFVFLFRGMFLSFNGLAAA